jgi:lipopolysaccharide biosynthesis regulator YciM
MLMGFRQKSGREPRSERGQAGVAKRFCELFAKKERAGNARDPTREALEKAAEEYPNNARVWADLGVFEFERQEYRKAADHFGKAVAMDPDNRNYQKLMALSMRKITGG